uniref:Nucleosome-remodeling factor subunit NURF301 n=1 Tax=Culex pipiens TaxID=7175 RepID=A0A8D8BHS9_CULPI
MNDISTNNKETVLPGPSAWEQLTNPALAEQHHQQQQQQQQAQASPAPKADGPQKVQIIRGPDGKVSVRGLNPGQQLIQTADGKLHVLSAAPGMYAKFVKLINKGRVAAAKVSAAGSNDTH